MASTIVPSRTDHPFHLVAAAAAFALSVAACDVAPERFGCIGLTCNDAASQTGGGGGGSTTSGGDSTTSGGGSTGGNACAGFGELCDSVTPCCDPVTADGGNYVCLLGLTCQACGPEGYPCTASTDCCPGMSCANEACTAPVVPCATSGQSCATATCCDGLACIADAGLEACGPPPCAPYGAADTAAGCCDGLALDRDSQQCLVSDGGPCTGSQYICANNEGCLASGVCGIPPVACIDYGGDCSMAPCCSGLTCEGGLQTCVVAEGAPCTATQGCGGQDVCLPSGVCGIQPTCGRYGDTGCGAINACCDYGLACDTGSDTCLVADDQDCTGTMNLCADGAVCPAASGICGLSTSCAAYMNNCDLQPCCTGLTCFLGTCYVGDSQPCATNGGEVCAPPDACDSTTDLCACVAHDGPCTPSELGSFVSDPCCDGYQCTYVDGTSAYQCI